MTSPASGDSSRLINLRMVLLPAPLRPTSASVSPRSTPRSRPRSRGVLPRVSRTPRNSISKFVRDAPRLKRVDYGASRGRDDMLAFAEVESAVPDGYARLGPHRPAPPSRSQKPFHARAGVVLNPFFDERIVLVQIAKVPDAAGHKGNGPAAA